MKKVLLLLCMIFMLTGCRSADNKEVRKVVNSAFKAYQARDLNEVKRYTGSSFKTTDIPFFKNNDKLVDPVIQSIVEKTSIKIKKVTVSGDNATVTGTVKVVNIGGIIGNVERAIRNREIVAEKNEQLAVFTSTVHDEVKALGASMREYDVEVNLQKIDGEWEIVLDEPLRDALTGGFITYRSKE